MTDTAVPPRPLSGDDIDEAAAVVAAAYVEDPLCAFMLPIEATRVRSLRKFFRAYLRASGTGCVSVTGSPIGGVAIWSRPGENLSVSLRDLAAFLPLLATLYPIGLLRARPALRLQDSLRARHAPPSHYYLDNVAVHPGQRGRGLASALIRPMLAEADAGGIATYTDTFTESNVAMYEHLGFRCVERADEARTGLTVWSLLRR